MAERTVRVLDVIAAKVPDRHEGLIEEHRVVMFKELNDLTISRIWAQYRGRNRPLSIRDLSIDWLVTDKPEDVDAFQPAHDCATCLEGAAMSRSFLVLNPGCHIALGNIGYTEVWSE